MKKRVVVTGVGAISPLGLNVRSMWEGALSCKSGIRKIDYFDTTGMASKIAGMLPKGQFDPDKYMTFSEQKRVDRFIIYAIAAATEAFEDSGYQFLSEEQKERTAVIIGSGIGGVQRLYETSVTLYTEGARRVSPFFIPSVLVNLASGHIAIKYGFKSLNCSVVSACASGTNSIGEAYNAIRNGYVDFAMAGGAEAAVCELGISGFGAARALSTKYNESPEESSRPWDKNRDGFVVGEGAGVLTLEDYEIAKKRGAKIYGEIVGYGTSCDAFHITAPLKDGSGAAKAIQNAIDDAQIDKESIAYINAHGTSTPQGDIAEVRAIKKVFNSHAYKLNVSSTKSAMGHLLGATGAVEAIISLLAIKNSVCPPTLNLHDPDKDCDLNLTALNPQERTIDLAMSNSFGFGGTNASLIFKKI
ncbi:MAG: beta-ketoacyl-ACP synthase II [Holosporales bacterium]|jgi:3-oxoacyl-[acyl-carrier-protein] synthase II|nr:beta-ketoacyl-ACP synthase II [Holosporales bacterium]